MKIEIWSDYACPFCYIAIAHLEAALEQFETTDDIEIVTRSYQLNPDAVANMGITMEEAMRTPQTGMSEEQLQQQLGQLKEMSEAAGLVMDYANARPTNTFDSHRLTHFAKAQGKGEEMEANLYKAYFEDGVDIGNHPVLLERAEQVGLEPSAVSEMLKGEEYAEQVTNDIQRSQALGLQGVPFFLFNEKYALSGAQPVEVFLQALDQVEKAAEEE